MGAAPFHADLADAPNDGTVVWRHADDRVRLRLGAWTVENAQGTILLFPGRTEYLEKYGKILCELTAAGWSVALIDWRGQGLSDRLFDDARLGHVVDFRDFQKDVAVLTFWADELGLPDRRVMLAHSMGGCIGLRALVDGLAIQRAVFSAPMWGIQMPGYARPLTYLLPPAARALKKETLFAPGTSPENYVTETGFKDNMLTTDRETYEWLAAHAEAAPEFALGGPSIQWVGSATKEMDRLLSAAKPQLPCLTLVGSDEQIVSVEAIKKYHEGWSHGQWHMVDGAKHEMMMETPPIRQRFLSDTLAFFEAT